MRTIDADALLKALGCDPDSCGKCKHDHDCGKHLIYTRNDICLTIQESPTVGGWISVNERLPEKPGRYLVCTSTITKVAWFLLSLKANPQFEYEMQGEPDRPGFFNGDSEGDWVQDDVTHWMVLPERPKEEE